MLLQGSLNYSAMGALKELIDNSIRALQKNTMDINPPIVRIFFDKDTLWVMDNGHGIDFKDLHLWLKQGSHSTSNFESLKGPLHLDFELGK